MISQEFERQPMSFIEVQTPTFVFLKVAHDLEALPRGLPDEVAKMYGGDIYSEFRTAQELTQELGPPSDKSEARQRSKEVFEELGARMMDSLTVNRSVVIDAFFATPDKRAPFIAAAHLLGAEVVALNVSLGYDRLKEARHLGLDSKQRKVANNMRSTRFKWARPREGFDHVLKVEDHFVPKKVLEQITSGLNASRAKQTTSSK